MRTAIALSLAALVAAGCNKHIFKVIGDECTFEGETRVTATTPPLDILIVVDNSGSMLEEQENLRDNFYDPRCPFLVPEVPRVPEHEQDPSAERLAELEEVCGFIQILGAYERDWRLGVITTDMNECDNRWGLAPQGHGRRPQRGCLQPAADGTKVLSHGDARMHVRFQEMLDGIGTWGSPLERGLDAALAFLDEETARPASCAGDLASFLRDDAELAVIFLTDEEDCSHAGPLEGGGAPLVDDSALYGCSVPQGEVPSPPPLADPELCYGGAPLTPPSWYAAALLEKKGERALRVAVIGGALLDDDGGAVPSACTTAAGAPVGGCYPSHGSSNIAALCGEEARAGEEPCCQADAAERYFALGESLGEGFFGDSICYDSFRSTLVELAQFIARTDRVKLDHAPLDDEAIVVSVTRRGALEAEPIARVPAGEDGDGFVYEGGDEIRFVGPSAPRPGDEIEVRVLVDDECRE